MSKKMICLISFVLMSGLFQAKVAEGSDPNLKGWWKLDETSGTIAADSSGSGNNGTVTGNNPTPQWVAGYRGNALRLGPSNVNGYLNFPTRTLPPLTGLGYVIKTLNECTFSIWVNWSGGAIWQRIFNFGSGTSNYIQLAPSSATGMRLALTNSSTGQWDEFDASIGNLPTNGWHHVAVTVSKSAKTMILYIDGNIVGSKTNCVNTVSGLGATLDDWLGKSPYTSPPPGDPYFNGSLDDFQIYNRVLSQAEIRKVADPEKASMPVPADNSVVGGTSALQWGAGLYAASVDGHHVYFGTSFTDVNQGLGGTDKGLRTPTNYPVAGLITGTTYYWRIDEVNPATPPYTWPGRVWSFKVQPLIAYNPSPPVGATYVDPNVDLTWSPGAKAKFHDVYLGTDISKVTDANRTNQMGVLVKQDHATTTYDHPVPLVFGATYYWRIDEVNSPNIWKGDVWSFTVSSIHITDPNLKGWWKFDDGAGSRALDSSGYNHHATLINGPNWVDGQIGGALQFNGPNMTYVDLPIGSVIASLNSATITTWVDFFNIGGWWQNIFNFMTGTTNYAYLTPRSGDNMDQPMYVGIRATADSAETGFGATSGILASGWHHLAVVIEPGNLQLYLDGQDVGSTSTSTVLSDLGVTTDNWLGRGRWPNWAYLDGSLDDFRIYNRALTQSEIVKVATPLVAWRPRPANNTTDVELTPTLIWSPGSYVAKHDVYFGDNWDAVNDANSSDPCGPGPGYVYKGRKDPNSYGPIPLNTMAKTYYWRIDEVNAATSPYIWRGDIWSFTTRDYLVVDDFESYNNTSNKIQNTWTKGGGGTVGNPEMTIIHGGKQSMPFDYNNTKTPYDSNATRTFDTPQNWTTDPCNIYSLKSLSLWFRGYQQYVGSFLESPAGTYTMTASGTDIGVPNPRPPAGFHDEFHYAYIEVSGECNIVTKVNSLSNTDAQAKAGVMIRDSLSDNSSYAMVCIMPDPCNGVRLQHRAVAGGTTIYDGSVAGITVPCWLKLKRMWIETGPDTGFYETTAWYSTKNEPNQDDWNQLGPIPEYNPTQTDVYIGLALTSHNTAATCTGVFSNVTVEEDNNPVTLPSPWTSHQDIGIKSNTAAPLYVTLQDSSTPAKTATVTHSDPNIVLQNTWQAWDIALSDFAPVDLTKIKKITIGVGNGQPVGVGTIYIDDIRRYIPRCMPGTLPDSADSSCLVNYPDLQILTNNWLVNDYQVTPVSWDPNGDPCLVAYYKFDGNFNDSAGGHNGEPNGASIIADPIRGQVASFDGVNDNVVLPIGPDINSLNSTTIATWVNFSNAGGAWQRIFDFGTGTTVYIFLSPRIDTAGAMRFAITIGGNGAEEMLTAPSTLASGWHHVAVTINAANDTSTLYLDGSLVARNTAATLAPSDLGVTTNNWLGRSQWAADAYFNGYLDDFRIYSRALSQEQVAWLAGKRTTFNQPLYLLLTPQNSGINQYNDGRIDLRDYAVLAEKWLEVILWP